LRKIFFKPRLGGRPIRGPAATQSPGGIVQGPNVRQVAMKRALNNAAKQRKAR
jgi:hypothetical protein